MHISIKAKSHGWAQLVFDHEDQQAICTISDLDESTFDQLYFGLSAMVDGNLRGVAVTALAEPGTYIIALQRLAADLLHVQVDYYREDESFLAAADKPRVVFAATGSLRESFDGLIASFKDAYPGLSGYWAERQGLTLSQIKTLEKKWQKLRGTLH